MQLPDCNTEASLVRHRENYYHYREGKRARTPAVTRQTRTDEDDVDVVLNEEEF